MTKLKTIFISLALLFASVNAMAAVGIRGDDIIDGTLSTAKMDFVPIISTGFLQSGTTFYVSSGTVLDLYANSLFVSTGTVEMLYVNDTFTMDDWFWKVYGDSLTLNMGVSEVLRFTQSGGVPYLFQVFDSTFVITYEGNVGIGNTAPDESLVIEDGWLRFGR